MRSPEVRLKRAQYLFGTICTIEVWGADAGLLGEALEAGFGELARIQRVLSPFDPSSELSRLSAVGHDAPCPVSDDLLTVLERALQVSGWTAGRYDPTVWPLLTLWRACEREQRWPAETERLAAVATIGHDRVHLDPARRTVWLSDPRTQLDLSSGAKGYALDRALRVLQDYPVSAVVLDAGGQLVTWPDDGPWRIGLADPRDRSHLLGTLQVSQRAVATSSQGEAHLVIDERIVGHLFDTRSGLPAATTLESATVAAPDGLWADLLSTAAFVVGPSEGPALLAHVPGAAGLLLDQHEGLP